MLESNVHIMQINNKTGKEQLQQKKQFFMSKVTHHLYLPPAVSNFQSIVKSKAYFASQLSNGLFANGL